MVGVFNELGTPVGVVAERFCKLKKENADTFDELFAQYYATVSPHSEALGALSPRGGPVRDPVLAVGTPLGLHGLSPPSATLACFGGYNPV